MYKNEEMDAINKTLGQGFVIRISDYIMYNKKTKRGKKKALNQRNSLSRH